MTDPIIIQGLDRAPLIARTIAYLDSAPADAAARAIAASDLKEWEGGPKALAAALRKLSGRSFELALMNWWGVCAQIMGAAGPGAMGAHRLLTDEEDDAVTQAVYATLGASRQGVAAELVEDIVRTTLYPLGLFRSSDAPEPDTCTAQKMALSPDEPSIHGVWAQCEKDPGHEGEHEGEFGVWVESGAWNTVAPEA